MRQNLEMPLFVLNEHEVHNEDGRPFPAHTPSTGSMYDNNPVIGSGILEMMERHKKDVQSRMAITNHGFRAMLEKTTKRLEPHDNQKLNAKSQVGPKRVSVENVEQGSPRDEGTLHETDRIIELYNDAITSNDKRRHKKSHLVSVSVADRPTVVSDEYLEVPNTPGSKKPKPHSPHPPLPMYEPLIPATGNNEGFVYESDERSDERNKVDESCCNKDEGNNANNNTKGVTLVSRVQFELPGAHPVPQGRASMHYNQAYDNDNLNPSQGASKPTHTLKPPKNVPKTPSKTKGVNHQSSNLHVTNSSFEVESSSDEDIRTTSSNFTPPPTRESSNSSSYDGWIYFLAFAVVIIAIIVWYWMANQTDGKSSSTDDEANMYNDYYGPVV